MVLLSAQGIERGVYQQQPREGGPVNDLLRGRTGMALTVIELLGDQT
jgi:hypothetical protein